MQISTKENGYLVRVSRGLSYPGFELTGLYRMFLDFSTDKGITKITGAAK